MRLLGQGDASPRLEDLSREAGVTPRQLRRDFHHWLGLAPADYRRLVRLQRSLGRIAHGMPLADAATAHGYADQAHMTRDVVAWTGLAPSQLAGARRSPSLAALQHALGGRVLLPHWG
jgi:AraC-like DNA-binding protein